MKSRSIKTVILSILGIAIFSVGITATLALFSLNKNLQEFSFLLNNEIRAERTIERMNVEFKRQVQEWKNVLLRGHDVEQREKYWNQFVNQENTIQHLAQEELGLLKSKPAIERKVKEFIQSHQKMGQAYRTGYQSFIDSGFSHIVGDKAVSGIDREPSKQLEEVSNSLSQISISHADDLMARSQKLVDMTIVVIACLSFGILVLAAFIMSRVIIEPLIKTSSQIDLLSNGKLELETDETALGEIGLLNSSTNQLASQLKHIMGTLGDTVENLQSSSRSMADHSEAQTNNALQQKAHTEQAAAAVEEMAHSAQQVSNSAELTATSTENTSQNAMQGLSQMQTVSSVIIQLKDDMSSATVAVTELAQQANRVNEVMTVIRSIAEQTNLLALNAAIEAARAGEHGRGFAVVADEVRALAQKTQTSTEEIEQILAAVKQGSESSVSTMNQGAERTDEVVGHISELASRLETLAGDISGVRDLNSEVATAANEQSTVTSDIALLISGLHDSAEVQKEQAHQGQEVSQSLTVLADDLTRTLQRFKA